VVRLATLLLVLAALLGRRPGGSIGLADDLHRGEVAELAKTLWYSMLRVWEPCVSPSPSGCRSVVCSPTTAGVVVV